MSIAIDEPITLGASDLVQAQALELAASALVVSTTSDAESAVLYRKDLQAFTVRVQAFFAPMKTQAHQLHKSICGRENEVLAPALRADAVVKRALTDWTTAQEAKCVADERRLAAEAKAAADKRALDEAAALAALGSHDEAEAVLVEAIAEPAPVISLPMTKATVSGLKTRKAWKFVVTDEAAVPRVFMSIDESKIRRVVDALKSGANISGVRVYSEDVPVR